MEAALGQSEGLRQRSLNEWKVHVRAPQQVQICLKWPSQAIFNLQLWALSHHAPLTPPLQSTL